LFANENADPAFLERAEGVLIRAIIANENRERVSALKLQRFQEPEHGFALIPIDIGQQFVNFLSIDPAQLAMRCCHCLHSERNSRDVVFVHVPIMRRDRKMFAFQLRTWNFIKRFP
jgi:hypothetical protein